MGMTYFEDLNVGDSWMSAEYTVDHEEMLAYGRANDPWPIHVDAEAATKSPFGGLIASGGYTITLMYRLGHEIVNQPDRAWAFLGALTGTSSSSSPFVRVTGCTNASQFWRNERRASRDEAS
jgi:acyl dehydratase